MAEGTGSSNFGRPRRRWDLASDCEYGDIHVNVPTSAFSRGYTLKERFEKLPVFKNPHCLIFTDSKGKLAITEDVISQISLIDVPLNVVAVCGLYRTGKSYLMNRLAGERKGFSLGATTKSHTKGIWVWCKVHPKQDGQVLLLLDTEGLADIKKGDSAHDNHLFSLALLLSSTMIYNMIGVFNQEALEKLNFITKLSQDIHVLGDNCSIETNDCLIRAISPFFILCLRDFYLDIECEENETKRSPDEYFEHCLEPDSHPERESYNMTRECITKYFPNRKCFTLSQPALGKKLKNVDTLPDKELDEDFIREVDEMKAFVYERKHKVLDAVTNAPVDGNVFATITTNYVDTLRKGTTLTYKDAFAQVSRHHNKTLVAKVLAEFNKEMDELPLPVKRRKILQDIYGYQQSKTIKKFRQKAYLFCTEEFEENIVNKMQKKWTEVEMRNSKVIKTKCTDVLEDLYQLHIQDGSNYNVEKGYEKYKKQMKVLEDRYNEKMDKYDTDERMLAWQEFKNSKHDDEMEIYKGATKEEDQAKYDQYKKEIEAQIRKGFEAQIQKMSQKRDLNVEQQLRDMELILTSIIDENNTRMRKEKEKGLLQQVMETMENDPMCILT